jgi:sec-independent protein translocase protein TatC
MSVSQDSPDPLELPSDPQAPGAEGRKSRRPKAKREPNPEARMPLIEHIRELRSRVIKALSVATVGVIAGWFIEPRLWNVIIGPYCRIPATYLRNLEPTGQHESCSLYVTGLFDALFIHLKLAVVIGLLISMPFWLYQFWAFVAPGLHSRERRWAYFFAGSALPLFAIGGGLAYFAMSKGLRFLVSLVQSHVYTLFTVDTYLSYFQAMLLIFGLAFELPLVMVLLNVAGILTHQRFAKHRRMIIFGVFAFAAVATPSPDPISMLLLAVPCVLLVELAEVFAWANDRRRARLTTAYPGLTPEEIKEYGLDVDPMASIGSDDTDLGS